MTAAVQPRFAFLAGFARHWVIWREAWSAEFERDKRDLRGGEREFLPAAIEIMEQPASPLGRGLLWSLCILFATAVAWSIVGRVDVVAVAQGKVVPVGHTKVVQPLEIGVVRSIHVKDGDRVIAGQPLIDLDPTDASADQDRLEREQLARALDVARLDVLLVLSGDEAFNDSSEVLTLKVPAGADPPLVQAARSLLSSQWRERSAKLGALDGQTAQRAAEIKVAQAEIDRLIAILPLLRDRSERLNSLSAKGLTSRIQSSQAEQQTVEAEKNLLGAQEKLTDAQAALDSSRQQRRQVERETESTWRKERSEALDKRSIAEQEILKARKRRELQRLVAPIDGTVTNLAAWTVGGVVKPGDTILNVVPLSAAPEIEAMVLNKDIGFVLSGQKVTVKLEAFPFTRYGTIPGEVIDVSRDANKDDKLGLIYPVRVRLETAEIEVDGKLLPISPGMSVSAEVITGNRRLIDYILSPILRYRHEAGRER